MKLELDKEEFTVPWIFIGLVLILLTFLQFQHKSNLHDVDMKKLEKQNKPPAPETKERE